MAQLPKLVRDRLKASVSPIGHPDPDVLAAFSERALPAHDRAVVMEHLARCRDCRDVVALALPATETVPVPHAAPLRHWFSWPALRWGTALAGILIVGALGIQQYRIRHAAPPTLARMLDRNQPAQNEVAQNSAPQTELRAPSAEARKVAPLPQEKEEVASHQNALQNDGSASTAALGTIGGPVVLSPPHSATTVRGNTGGAVAGIGGGIGAGRYAYAVPQGPKMAMNSPPKDLFRNPSPQSAPPPAAKQLPPSEPEKKVPSMSEVVEVTAAAAPAAEQDQIQGQRQDQQYDLYGRQPPQADTDQDRSEGDKQLSKAKLPSAPSPTAANALSLVPLPAPNWNISSAGALQRSFDGGKTWQDVDVNASPAMSRSFAATEVVTVTEPTVRDDNKIANKSLKRSKSTPVFRAVAANGSDVWAGGSAGALYHSADAGNHWTRIIPSAGSVVLTADIASIQFSDPQHGTITTVTTEVWTTTDAGRSWQKQ